MSLLLIPVPVLNRLLTTAVPTPAQYSTYHWGVTTREKYNAIFEACGVGFLGVFAAYFLSFVVGQFVATILGVIAAFWIIISPELKAYQRNWELRGERDLVDPWVFDDEDYFDNEVSSTKKMKTHRNVSDIEKGLIEREYRIHRWGCAEPNVANNWFIKKNKRYFMDEGEAIILFLVKCLL